MLFTCVSPSCTDPRHGRRRVAAFRRTGAVLVKPAKKSLPRGKARSLRIDIHCHYLNPEVQEKVAPYNPGQYDALVKFANALTRETNLKQGRDRAAKLSDIATRLKAMDRMGVDIQAVSPAPNQTNYWAEPGMGAELSRMVNEGIARIVAETPDRFVGLGTVPLQNAGLAVAELEHCVKKLGLRGVEINPNVNGMELSDPRLDADVGGRATVFAGELAELPLAGEEPSRIADARGERLGEIASARPGFEAVPGRDRRWGHRLTPNRRRRRRRWFA